VEHRSDVPEEVRKKTYKLDHLALLSDDDDDAAAAAAAEGAGGRRGGGGRKKPAMSEAELDAEERRLRAEERRLREEERVIREQRSGGGNNNKRASWDEMTQQQYEEEHRRREIRHRKAKQRLHLQHQIVCAFTRMGAALLLLLLLLFLAHARFLPGNWDAIVLFFFLSFFPSFFLPYSGRFLLTFTRDT
jgi:hypothetical protein